MKKYYGIDRVRENRMKRQEEQQKLMKEAELERQRKLEEKESIKNKAKRRIAVPFNLIRDMNTGEFECPICQRLFAHKELRDSHLKNHANLKPFKCRNCTKTFKVKNNLALHEIKCPNRIQFGGGPPIQALHQVSFPHVDGEVMMPLETGLKGILKSFRLKLFSVRQHSLLGSKTTYINFYKSNN